MRLQFLLFWFAEVVSLSLKVVQGCVAGSLRDLLKVLFRLQAVGLTWMLSDLVSRLCTSGLGSLA